MLTERAFIVLVFGTANLSRRENQNHIIIFRKFVDFFFFLKGRKFVDVVIIYFMNTLLYPNSNVTMSSYFSIKIIFFF